MAQAPSLEKTIRSLFHDIRNPLAVMNNSLYFIKTKVGPGADAKVAKHLRILESEIQRANDILTQSLAYFAEPELKLQKTSLGELLGNLPSGAALPPNISAKSEIAEDIQALIDRAELTRALSAILANAIEAMPEGGTVALRARAEGKSAVLEIADTGPGLSAEAQEKLFTPYFTTKERHLGLGLAVARKIILRHGGSLEAARASTRTVFKVSLPLAG